MSKKQNRIQNPQFFQEAPSSSCEHSSTNRKKNQKAPKSLLDHEDLLQYPDEEVDKNFQLFYGASKSIKNLSKQISQLTSNMKMKFREVLSSEAIYDIFNGVIKNKKGSSQKWSDQLKCILKWVVPVYTLLNSRKINKLKNQDWREIAKLIPTKNAHQCKIKWLDNVRMKLTEIPWTADEDEVLCQIHQFIQQIISYSREFSKLGLAQKWNLVSKELQRRCQTDYPKQPKQCRERWVNKLNPFLKNEPWTIEEEIKLLKIALILGTRWSLITSLFDNKRSESSLKNKYQSLLKKQKLKYHNDELDSAIFEHVQEIRLLYSERYKTSFQFEEIDHYSLQFALLAFKELKIKQGNESDLKKIEENELNLLDELREWDIFSKLSVNNQCEKRIKPSNIRPLKLSSHYSGFPLAIICNQKIFVMPEELMNIFSKLLKNEQQFVPQPKIEQKEESLNHTSHNVYQDTDQFKQNI